MRLIPAIAIAMACLGSVNADAATATATEQIMQKGQFEKPGCKSDSKDPDYDACICEADIRYPQISGIKDEQTQARLNDWFKQEAARTVCEGDNISPQAKQTSAASSHATLSVHYEVTFSSPAIIAFKFTDWAYTGGAHGNGSVIGIIVDLQKGKILTPDDLFSKEALARVNQAIYDALAAKPEEEVFRDQVEARKGAFIKGGECQGCTLVLNPEGVQVLFQTYEVAPYGAGNTDVLVPAKLISNPALAEALKESQSAARKP